jgi:hypothetical protein
MATIMMGERVAGAFLAMIVATGCGGTFHPVTPADLQTGSPLGPS